MVNEATFRLNEDNCKVATLNRMRAFVRGIAGRRLPCAALVAPNGLSARCVPVWALGPPVVCVRTRRGGTGRRLHGLQ